MKHLFKNMPKNRKAVFAVSTSIGVVSAFMGVVIAAVTINKKESK